MTSRALRRRLHHGDVDERRNAHLETTEFDGLSEPLLGNYKSENRQPEVTLYYIFLMPRMRKYGYDMLFRLSLILILLHFRGTQLEIFGMMNRARWDITGHFYFLS